jgi:hypothetical protein
MSLMDRLFNKPPKASATRTILGLTGAMTAHQAWAEAAPVAKALDPDAKLTLITSGLDMSPEGRSRTWEFIFFLPRRKATAMLSLEPDPQSQDVDHAKVVLTQRTGAASALDTQKPCFPDTFRDSPEVVAEFSAQGVDFIAGPSDMKLEGRVLPSGDAVWVTYDWDQERTTPFAVVVR